MGHRISQDRSDLKIMLNRKKTKIFMMQDGEKVTVRNDERKKRAKGNSHNEGKGAKMLMLGELVASIQGTCL